MENNDNKMEFIHQAEGSRIAVAIPAGASLGEALEAFESFLLAVGYVFDGQVDIIEPDMPIESDLYDPKAEEN